MKLLCEIMVICDFGCFSSYFMNFLVLVKSFCEVLCLVLCYYVFLFVLILEKFMFGKFFLQKEMLDCLLYGCILFCFWYYLFVMNLNEFRCEMVVCGDFFNLFVMREDFLFLFFGNVGLLKIFVVVCNVCKRGEIMISLI